MRSRLLTLLLAFVVLVLPDLAHARASPQTTRETTDLSSGWRFLLGDPGEAAADPAFDDREWKRVDVPHTWNALGEYRIGRTAATRNVQGVGWYRRTIEREALPHRPRHFLQFDAVGNVADVWVNGDHVGRHAGAFSRFRFDITELLRPGRNVIAVRADNSLPAPGSSTEHVVPLLGDFFIHGGIYRPVALVSVAAAHFALDDHGGPGVYARTLTVSGDRADIAVRARLTNTGATGTGQVMFRLVDANGRVAASDASAVTLGPGRGETETVLRVARPRLWDGRRDPHRYRLIAELVLDGRAVDRVEQHIGIRTMRIDADRGFFLNGRHLSLRGVSRHQDYLGQGWALSPADHIRDMDIIAEMGANSVRFAHYQHAPEWFDLADARGMIVWAELALVNKVAFSDAEAHPALIANAREQLVEQIRQHANSPSVATWGIGNEVDIDLAFNRLGPRADPRPVLRDLHALAKREDPDRPTVIADCCEDTPGDKALYLSVLSGIADLMGYNRYFGWYYGALDDLGPHLDRLHAKHPGLPVSVSEYGAGAALTQHSDDPARDVRPTGRPHPEEYQALYHESQWPQIAARPYLWGSWIWNMFDFSSTVRAEGDATDINDKGLVTFDRRVRKDAFYYYKANWSDAPVLHIAGRRFTDRRAGRTDIKIYSNAADASLTLNGRSLGTSPCVRRVCLFRSVSLGKGSSDIVATARIGKRTLTDRITWQVREPEDTGPSPAPAASDR